MDKFKMDLQLFAGEFAHGATLTLGGGIGAVANLTNIDGLDVSSDDIDVSDHNSTDGFREYIPGLIDGGEVPVEGNFNPTVAIAFYDAQVARTVLTGCTLEFPDAATTTWTFDCYVKQVTTSAPHDDKLPFSATLKITGRPTLA